MDSKCDQLVLIHGEASVEFLLDYTGYNNDQNYNCHKNRIICITIAVQYYSMLLYNYYINILLYYV